MNRSKILRNVAISFFVFASVIHIVIYTFYLIFGRLVLDDLAYSELSWGQLTSMYPHIAYLMSVYIRMMGLVFLVLEIFFLFGVYLIFWKSSKTAWVLVTIGTISTSIMELIQNFPIIGFDIPYMAYILLTVLITFALTISGIELFGKKNLESIQKS